MYVCMYEEEDLSAFKTLSVCMYVCMCVSGRYDKLLQSMAGGEPVPAVGFGFGDAVIVEMLKVGPHTICFTATPIHTCMVPLFSLFGRGLQERGLLPQLPRNDVQVQPNPACISYIHTYIYILCPSQVVVYAMGSGLRPQAAQIASQLRQGQVDTRLPCYRDGRCDCSSVRCG